MQLVNLKLDLLGIFTVVINTVTFVCNSRAAPCRLQLLALRQTQAPAWFEAEEDAVTALQETRTMQQPAIVHSRAAQPAAYFDRCLLSARRGQLSPTSQAWHAVRLKMLDPAIHGLGV